MMVPPVRVERTLLAELDFESSASTNSATGARNGAFSTPGTQDKRDRYSCRRRDQNVMGS